MHYTIKQIIQTAKKKHVDSGFDEIFNWFHYSKNDLSIQDQDRIFKLICNPDRRFILPGQKYEYSVTVGEGDFFVFKTKLEFAELIKKYKIYSED